jgi:hypothetical protein
MRKKKNWREESREHGCLIGGVAKVSYELDGKMETDKVKFVGKFWHIEELDRTENDPYFKGVIFDMYNNEQGSVSWTKEEFHKFCETFTELF